MQSRAFPRRRPRSPSPSPAPGDSSDIEDISDSASGASSAAGSAAGGIAYDDLARVFHLPITGAAKALGVCVTVLKKRCRRHGVRRWPHRKLKSLDKLKEKLEREGAGSADKAYYNAEIGAIAQKKDMLFRSSPSPAPSSAPPAPPAPQAFRYGCGFVGCDCALTGGVSSRMFHAPLGAPRPPPHPPQPQYYPMGMGMGGMAQGGMAPAAMAGMHQQPQWNYGYMNYAAAAHQHRMLQMRAMDPGAVARLQAQAYAAAGGYREEKREKHVAGRGERAVDAAAGEREVPTMDASLVRGCAGRTDVSGSGTAMRPLFRPWVDGSGAAARATAAVSGRVGGSGGRGGSARLASPLVGGVEAEAQSHSDSDRSSGEDESGRRASVTPPAKTLDAMVLLGERCTVGPGSRQDEDGEGSGASAKESSIAQLPFPSPSALMSAVAEAKKAEAASRANTSSGDDSDNKDGNMSHPNGIHQTRLSAMHPSASDFDEGSGEGEGGSGAGSGSGEPCPSDTGTLAVRPSSGSAPTTLDGFSSSDQDRLSSENVTPLPGLAHDSKTLKRQRTDAVDALPPQQAVSKKQRTLAAVNGVDEIAAPAKGADVEAAETFRHEKRYENIVNQCLSLRMSTWSVGNDMKVTSAAGPKTMLERAGVPPLGRSVGEVLPDPSAKEHIRLQYRKAMNGERVEFMIEGGNGERFLKVLAPLRRRGSTGTFGVTGMLVEVCRGTLDSERALR